MPLETEDFLWLKGSFFRLFGNFYITLVILEISFIFPEDFMRIVEGFSLDVCQWQVPNWS